MLDIGQTRASAYSPTYKVVNLIVEDYIYGVHHTTQPTLTTP